jgi:hypothetical protein
MHNALSDNGVVIANIGSSISGEASHFLRAELTTYRAIFPQVLIFKVRTERGDADLQNLMLVAWKSKRPFEMRSDDAEMDTLLSQLYLPSINSDLPDLTDDLAPVEYYNSLAQRYFMRHRR